MWNAFKGARNQFYDQSELAEWLKSGFESLGKYNTKTLRAKLRATDGGYGIRLVDNLKVYPAIGAESFCRYSCTDEV